MAKSPKPSPRYSRLPGTSKNYVDNTTGQVYSYRQYLKIDINQRDRTLTGPQLQKRRFIQARYNSLFDDYFRKRQQTDPSITRGQLRQDSRYKELQALLRSKTKKGKPNQTVIKKALKELGRREGLPDNVKLGQSAKLYTRKDNGKWERNR